MKKIVRLTESDLARIVKRVIKENKDEPKIKARYFTQFGSDTTTVSLEELLDLVKDFDVMSLSYIGDNKPKIKARYFTQFGSDTTIVTLKELLDLVKDFDIMSLSYVD